MFRRVLALAAVAAIAALPVKAAEFNDAQKKEIGNIVRQYLLENPGLIYEVADKHQQNMQKAADESAKTALKEQTKALFENKEYGVIGNKKAKVPFVEFFDYNCGYCKHAYPEMVKLTDGDKNIKVILIDTPILGPTSTLAAKWAIAAGKLGKYVEFHAAAMKFEGPKSEETLSEIAKGIGLDPAKVKEIAEKQETTDQITKNMELFQKLGLNGTPAFALPDRVVRGASSAEAMKALAKDYLDTQTKK